MSDWVKDDSGLSVGQITARQTYKLEPHAFAPHKKLAWMKCKRCGLLNLRNEFTLWCVKMGCNSEDHPEYASKRKAARP